MHQSIEHCEFMFTIGRRLAEERERLGYSQKLLAGRMAKTVRTQIKYEQGTTMPDALYLAWLNDLGADVYYIVTGQRSGNELPVQEAALLKAFREKSPDSQDGVLRMLVGTDDPRQIAEFAHQPLSKKPGHGAIQGQAQVVVGGSNNVQMGTVGKSNKRKAKRDGE